MTTVPNKNLIGITRKFTKEGIHPYDEVVWETRDSRLTNYQDGSIAFEQLGVEVPSTWSVNATNILAQKYFRGALGGPEREYSLKQVADRVVDTITSWGIKDGYFDNDEEALIFSDELKHLIIHQKAAFNSPVWFNIGVSGVPAQASACFILAVEDSMDSILNWYTEEGIIFKGGSGAGVNLSKLRASSEHLKGGGTASGPVSFMRGADASAGTIKSGGKCFKEGTLVSTPNGWVAIEELSVGDLVLTHEGPQPVADFMPNGVKQCYKVQTEEGYSVEVTEGHKFAFWDATEGEFKVKPLEDFSFGEKMYVLLSKALGGEQIELVAPQPSDPRNATTIVEMQMPSVLDDKMAYILGLMYGDGTIMDSPLYRVGVSFATDEAGSFSAQQFSEYCLDVFGEKPRVLDDNETWKNIGFTRKRIVEFLKANGIAKGKAGNLGFPGQIMKAQPEVRAAFLAGAIDADGTYQKRGGWNISSIDREFLGNLQILLLSLGIPSKIKLNRKQDGNWQNLYRLSVVGYTFIEKLSNEILPYSAKCKMNYVPSAGTDKGWGYRPSLLKPLITLNSKQGGAGYIERRIGVNETSGYRGMTALLEHPDQLVAKYASQLTTTVQVSLLSVVPTTSAPTYDIEVSGTHLLSANGLYASNTRRAAKMVMLDVDHPDIEEFIWCKAHEEKKARALESAGFDMSLDGKDIISVQYQNANNSVRITDEFMQAVLDDDDWNLISRGDGSIIRTVKARSIFHQISQAAWECADPGIQFDTTINDWHTSSNTDRINGSNPCFPGSTRVHTDRGQIRFDEMALRVRSGETFRVWTHDATNSDAPTEEMYLSTPETVEVTGVNDILRLELSNGMQLRCTPNHRIWTTNRGYVEAENLTSDDIIKIADLAVPSPLADYDFHMPASAALAAGQVVESHNYAESPTARWRVILPGKWTSDFAHLLGWLVGDGSFNALTNNATWIYATAEEQESILPLHQRLLVEICDGDVPKPAVMSNGTVQLRAGRGAFTVFLSQLGLSSVKSHQKRVPESIFHAPDDIAAAFLRGLFDTDGTVVSSEAKGNDYVGLDSSSIDLLRDAQLLLTRWGIRSRIYNTRSASVSAFTYTTTSGQERVYDSKGMYSLRITTSHIHTFASSIGFELESKQERLSTLISSRSKGFYSTNSDVRLVSAEYDGVETTYNLSEPRNHSYIASGIVVRNCSEYMHIDNSACNLASLNLMKFLNNDDTFDVESYKAAIEVVFTAQEILVGNADYPTKAIAENTVKFRQLGLGYANLGALLMANGLPYDSDEGRALAEVLTAIMTGHAYATSAKTAARMGPHDGYAENQEPMLGVLRKHRDAIKSIDSRYVPNYLMSAAQDVWREAVDLAEIYGTRNAQASVLAPTGTIGFLLDCDTTGVEPDLGLVKTKRLVGGGTMSIVNQTVPRALINLGYGPEEVEDIVSYVDNNHSIVGAPYLKEEHLPVFACSMGDNTIHYLGHVKMMGAVQPFISGAISKTVNMPEEATIEDVEQLHIDAWKMGVKAVAIYRDNCKVAQPLSTGKNNSDSKEYLSEESNAPSLQSRIVELEAQLARAQAASGETITSGSSRERLPRRRLSHTVSFRVADCEGYIIVGEYEDGRPGEVFIKVSKQGSTLAGVMDAFSISISLGLQHGVPLATFVRKFANTKFEPAGITDDADLRIATSLVDYMFRRLALDYLTSEEREDLGIFSTGERTQATLPGVEESATPSTRNERPEIRPDHHYSTVIKAAAKTEHPDAPFCYSCGDVMVRAGSCFVCRSCGSTSGCS